MTLLSLFAALFATGPAQAHEIRPALLTVTRVANECIVTWKQPLAGELSTPLTPHLSAGWEAAEPIATLITGSMRTLSWRRAPCTAENVRSLVITIEGLSNSITNAILLVDDGIEPSSQYVLSAERDSIDLTKLRDHPSGLLQYVVEGIFHILGGVDHLAFILALTFLCRNPRQILIGLTGFTLGHSTALFLVALKVALPNPQFIEVLVGLSIVFVAAEAMRQDKAKHGFFYRYPFVASTGFGAIHGTAYSSAIGQIADDLCENVAMIASFNAGVEVGQLIFLAVIAGLFWLFKRYTTREAIVTTTALYIAGTYGAFLATIRFAEAI